MSTDITRHVVTVSFHEQALTELNELTNHLERAGFTLTLTDDEGKVHELGTHSYGLVGPQSQEEVIALASGLAESALGREAEITSVTFEQWLQQKTAS
ncbi:endoribonuclease GhoS [Enterobacteriaceae bacterium 89]|nr:endoribonuclease GhoS [Enterobacteriaceae bacterium 89]